MHNTLRATMLTAFAATALALAIGTASARSLSASSQTIRVTFGRLEFLGFATVRCPVTLEGSFHARTMAKVERALVGAATASVVNQAACTGGTVSAFNGTERYNGTTSPNTLPWHLQYESFRTEVGLPNIEAIRIILTRLRVGVTVPGICTGQFGSATDAITFEVNRDGGGNVTTISPIEGRNTLTLIRTDAGICTNGRKRGTGEVFQLGTTNRIRVTLI